MAEKNEFEDIIREAFLELNQEFLNQGVSLEILKSIAIPRNSVHQKRLFFIPLNIKTLCTVVTVSLIIGIAVQHDSILTTYVYGPRCYIPNNYFVWEFTRPVSDCSFCRGVDAALILPNITKEEFAQYAYSSKPIIVKNAIKHWKASRAFTLEFFRNMYDSIEGAYESVEEEGQFLPFKSNFNSLKEVFEMSKERAANAEGEEPWYVGWKNCHPQVLQIMRNYYDPPHFFPDDAEIPGTNYIFLGYEHGASMHLDYIPRLMWQGQILGKKMWTVAPTPECNDVCGRFNFSVDTNDVVLLDTRIWYHATYVKGGQLSLTLTSEYG